MKFYFLGYLHRDIKRPNILLESDFLPHIYNFLGAYEYDQSAGNTHVIESFFGYQTKAF
jgi:3-deoxy-D-arabino-heptulosonate 7-phosphate (DAHP) synthase